MKGMENEAKVEMPENNNPENVDEVTNLQEEQSNEAENIDLADNMADDFDSLKIKYDELKDSHLRLVAEFDNYRKRTLREKAELIKSGGESALTNLLPVVDDFSRAVSTLGVSVDATAVAEGVELIYNKFMSYLAQQGVKPIDAVGQPFDTEIFDAIATIPAPEEDLKGKVVDCVQTGYVLYDKVIRHAKVVVGE